MAMAMSSPLSIVVGRILEQQEDGGGGGGGGDCPQ